MSDDIFPAGDEHAVNEGGVALSHDEHERKAGQGGESGKERLPTDADDKSESDPPDGEPAEDSPTKVQDLARAGRDVDPNDAEE